VYATCIHCQHALGRNDLLETLPVGRRIAFDEAAGRLWVVCAACSRWNLVPFDSRYEAIEASERLFRETPLRLSTGQIGLAKTREGTELVRIGSPLRPEMAAWRYAGSLTRRRMRYAFRTAPITIGLASIAKVFPFVQFMSGPAFPALLTLSLASTFAVARANRRRLATIDMREARVDLNRNVVSCIRIDASDTAGLRLLVPTIPASRSGDDAITRFFGETFGDTRRVIVGGVVASDDEDVDRLQRYVTADGELSQLFRVIMPIVNEVGASEAAISDATAILSRYDTEPRHILFGRRKDWSRTKRMMLADISEPRRLALEMLVHEESERRWLGGELKALEAEWVRANEIAEIADGLTRSPLIEERLTALRNEENSDTRSSGIRYRGSNDPR
jgi:hypothetical protein